MSNNGLEAMTLLYSYDNSLPKKLLFVPKLAISYSATRMGRCQPTLGNVPGRYFFCSDIVLIHPPRCNHILCDDLSQILWFYHLAICAPASDPGFHFQCVTYG